MPRIDKVKIKNKAVKYNDALAERAPEVEFKGYKQVQLDNKLNALDAKEAFRADLQIQLDLTDEEIDDMYVDLDDTCIDIRSGVEGHLNYGNDCPLYGAMGHVRKSDRKSGKTNKKKSGESGEGDK